jgi:hypothetical protein
MKIIKAKSKGVKIKEPKMKAGAQQIERFDGAAASLSKRKTEFASLTRYNKKRDFKQKRAQEEN